jgi:amino acid transporter
VNKKQFVTAYRLGFAFLIPVTIAIQLAYSLERAQNFSMVNFFSYFTIQSNLFAAVVLLMSAYVLWKRKKDPQLENLRGAATLYMVVTGIIYSLLLRGDNLGTLLPWVNDVLHRLVPIVMLLDWLYYRPERKFTTKEALLWLIYPLTYVAYTLVHGPLARHWYPYPFLNVALHGYGRVALNCVVIAISMLILALAIAKLSRLQFSSPDKRKI